MTTTPRSLPRPRSGSVMVAAGILASRLAGLVRQVVVNSAIGLGVAADAFGAAFKIPNLMQNLLGEGALSASFIPVYSGLLAEGREREADRLARAVAGLLAAASAGAVLVFWALARPITRLLTPGLTEESFDLAVSLVRIMAVGIAFLVMSAWCLGVLNSHRRFFLSYASPVVWNATQIAVVIVVVARSWDPNDIITALAWGMVLGGLLQFAVQLPTVLAVAPDLRQRGGTSPHTRVVLGRFGPAVLGRGVTQISAFVDLWLVSFAATGAVGALFTGQVLFTLPLSLFAMSVVAAELPELSRLAQTDPTAIGPRSDRGLRQISFFIVFCAVAYLALGDVIVGLLFERGEFTSDDTTLVWFVIAAYGIGLPANASSRMMQNTLYSVGDTAGPARIAVVRVLFDAAFTLLLMFNLDRIVVSGNSLLGLDQLPGIFGPLSREVRADDEVVRLGAAGSALGSALAAWIELVLLQRLARRRFERPPAPFRVLARLAVAGALAFVTGAAVKLVLDPLPLLVTAPLAVGVSGFVYTVAAFRTGVAESALVLRPIRRLLWRR